MVKTIYKRFFNVIAGIIIIFLGILALGNPNKFIGIIVIVLSASFIVSSIAGISDSLQEQSKGLRLINLLIEGAILALGILLLLGAFFEGVLEIAAYLLVIGMSIMLSVSGIMRIISGLTLKMDAKWFRVVNFVLVGVMIFFGTVILWFPLLGVVVIYFYVVISLFFNGSIRILLGIFGTYEVFD